MQGKNKEKPKLPNGFIYYMYISNLPNMSITVTSNIFLNFILVLIVFKYRCTYGNRLSEPSVETFSNPYAPVIVSRFGRHV